MPMERHHPYPFPTAEDVDAAPGDRETKAARNIMVRHIEGLVRRPFLMGESDHAPILRGVKDLTQACYRLIDALDQMEGERDPQHRTTAYVDAHITDLRDLMEDHGCPPATAEEPTE